MQLAFRTRLMLGTTALVVLFVGVAAVAFSHLIDAYYEREVEREYAEARASFDTQMRILLESLDQKAAELARSPRLLATVAIEGIDEATVLGLLPELPASLIAVVRPDGRVLAGQDAWPADDDLSHMPDYDRHFELGSSTHVWPHPSGLAVVGVAPLVQGGELLGSLVVGERVGDAFAARIGTLSGRHVLIADGGRLIGRHWKGAPPTDAALAEVVATEAAGLPAEGRRAIVSSASSDHSGIALALTPGRGAVFLAHDLDAVYALRARMRWLLFLIGGGLTLGGLFAAARTATKLSRPMQTLTAVADRLRDGDLAARVGELRADRELVGLGRSFDAMASTLQDLVADVRAQAERAEAANRAKDGFLTSMSHELRTP
ncbi:MAG: HAMP domain-containing protein, partial [Planctomycetes bacterium]|nr:HAMP domain-containing protein [Planctomycetota bacterium]